MSDITAGHEGDDIMSNEFTEDRTSERRARDGRRHTRPGRPALVVVRMDDRDWDRPGALAPLSVGFCGIGGDDHDPAAIALAA